MAQRGLWPTVTQKLDSVALRDAPRCCGHQSSQAVLEGNHLSRSVFGLWQVFSCLNASRMVEEGADPPPHREQGWIKGVLWHGQGHPSLILVARVRRRDGRAGVAARELVQCPQVLTAPVLGAKSDFHSLSGMGWGWG